MEYVHRTDALVDISMDSASIVKMQHFTTSTILELMHMYLIFFKSIHYFNHSCIQL